jgi:hypothetical protein
VVVEGIIGIRSFRLSLCQTFLIKVVTFVTLSLQSRYNGKTIMIDERDCTYIHYCGHQKPNVLPIKQSIRMAWQAEMNGIPVSSSSEGREDLFAKKRGRKKLGGVSRLPKGTRHRRQVTSPKEVKEKIGRTEVTSGVGLFGQHIDSVHSGQRVQ